MSDINGLKLINDAFGHAEGDQLLISAAKVITDSCRETDLVARIGGDEFVVIISQIENHHAAGDVAQKIVDELQEMTALETLVHRPAALGDKVELNFDVL